MIPTKSDRHTSHQFKTDPLVGLAGSYALELTQTLYHVENSLTLGESKENISMIPNKKGSSPVSGRFGVQPVPFWSVWICFGADANVTMIDTDSRSVGFIRRGDTTFCMF